MAVAGALILGATPLLAQRGPRGARMGVGPAGPGVEMLLRAREQLDLTDEQVASLEALRDQMQSEMVPVREEMREAVRQAREAEREAWEARREQMQGFRDRIEAMREGHRQRLEEVLTEEQRAQLDALAGQRGRRSRAGAGVGPGARGGFGPGMGTRGFRRSGPRAFAPGAGFRGWQGPQAWGPDGPAFRRRPVGPRPGWRWRQAPDA
jgi:Spy/CpxP family protein refolding chaperone